ncbi:MAG TPA: hypothetical protein VM597_31825 [Gemmataceae bacterium]|jgi:hypothetical protein|nr:hypothetical protein [Gemmataceae bacterium]
MRAFLVLLSTGLTIVAADPPRRTATVDVDGAEVRSGPALKFPAVADLRKGDSLLILRDEDKWFYAIEPPPGSVSWIKAIHLGKVDVAAGKANVPVAVDGAEVFAGRDRKSGPSNHASLRLPRGTIVEVTGPSVRIDAANWYPITPPDGDVRWIQKNNIKSASIAAVAPPPARPDFAPVSGDGRTVAGAAPAAGLPRDLTGHRLYDQAVRAEQANDFATAKTLYARIYTDLWDQKADRDAIIICYNRYTRCNEKVEQGGTGPTTSPRSAASTPRTDTTARSAPTDAKWNGPGYLQELQRVFVEGQPVYSLTDDRGAVAFYVTAADGINLKSFNGRRVQVYGAVQQRPELYRPHIAAERVEAK